MKPPLFRSALVIAQFVLATVSVFAADPIARAGNGMPIPSPIDKTTVEVKAGTQTIQIPAGMVYVPAGRFTFGENETRELPGYAIARFEVTNAEYKAFIEATQHRGVPRYWKNGVYPEGKASHPVLFVSLVDAEAYCAWVSQETGWRVVVPTAEQWEKAARGPQAFLYPWGNDKDSHYSNGKLQTHFNYNAVCTAWMLDKEARTLTSYVEKSQEAGKQGRVEDIMTSNGQVFSLTPDGGVAGWIDHNTNTGFVNTQIYRDLVNNGGFTTPVGTYENGRSAYGCYDMAGNAYEWTSSIIVATNGAERGREVNDVRGGSWYSTARSGQSLCTGEGRARSGGYHSVGFRIAMNP
ncbi:formylglycine-generating enzyme family protein [Prosthecobacter sp.]|uniref:formylglycine-generating enzyme family protein n=1 Tax=Prosthecobacter sp. TaxID=1965333 RepID=UPI003784BF2B